MNTPTLPTPYELCQIVAAMGYEKLKDEEVNPKEMAKAVSTAMMLWSEAVEQLSKLQVMYDSTVKKQPRKEPAGAKAVKTTMKLWSTAIHELSIVQKNYARNAQRESDKKASKSAQETKLKFEQDPVQARCISMDSSLDQNREADAWKWLQANAPDKRDRFKSMQGFKKAWSEYCAEKGFAPSFSPEQMEPESLQQFVDHRVRKRRDADSLRKNQSRSKATSAGASQNKTAPDSKGKGVGKGS